MIQFYDMYKKRINQDIKCRNKTYTKSFCHFGRSVNPIQTRGADYAHHITT